MRLPMEQISHAPTVIFRFYAELNDFLTPRYRQRDFTHPLSRDASVKHMIEALGVPHTEVELILIDGEAADFSQRLRGGERVAVYPHFGAMTTAAPVRLRAPPARGLRFLADAHLGQLARNLRMFGFDVLYRNDYSDAEVARIAVEEDRIVLTRDRDLLIRKEIVHGCYLHAVSLEDQMVELATRFELARNARAFSRCLVCNGALRVVGKETVAHRVPAHSHASFERFHECEACAQVFWEGSHVVRMRERIERILQRSGRSGGQA